jgi:hypothetical protein
MAHGPGRAGLDFGAMGRAGPIHCSIAHGLTFLKPARPIRSSVPDSNDTALLLIDVINHLDFEGNEGLV